MILYIPLAALYDNLRTAGVRVPPLDPPGVPFTPTLLVAVAIGVTWKRYQ